MTITDWLIGTALIIAFSVCLVLIDPLTIITDWWRDRR